MPRLQILFDPNSNFDELIPVDDFFGDYIQHLESAGAGLQQPPGGAGKLSPALLPPLPAPRPALGQNIRGPRTCCPHSRGLLRPLTCRGRGIALIRPPIHPEPTELPQ